MSQELRKIEESIATSEIIQVELSTIPTEEQVARLKQIPHVLVLEHYKDHLKFNFEQGTNHLLHVANTLED